MARRRMKRGGGGFCVSRIVGEWLQRFTDISNLGISEEGRLGGRREEEEEFIEM